MLLLPFTAVTPSRSAGTLWGRQTERQRNTSEIPVPLLFMHAGVCVGHYFSIVLDCRLVWLEFIYNQQFVHDRQVAAHEWWTKHTAIAACTRKLHSTYILAFKSFFSVCLLVHLKQRKERLIICLAENNKWMEKCGDGVEKYQSQHVAWHSSAAILQKFQVCTLNYTGGIVQAGVYFKPSFAYTRQLQW